MSELFVQDGNRIIFRRGEQTLWVEAHAPGILRVRRSVTPAMPDRSEALAGSGKTECEIKIEELSATICTAGLQATIGKHGSLRFSRIGEEGMEDLLVEQGCNFRPRGSDAFAVTADFASDPGEAFYGLGQYEHGLLNQKGCVLDLIQINHEISIPFYVSSKRYGFVWHNPATGRVELANNRTRWVADLCNGVDYFVIGGDSYAEILGRYATLTGYPLMLPEWAAGFWQCKLRYRTQEELLSVAREYKARGLPLSVIVIDFFHWTKQGDFRFDPVYWPDPAAMVRELEEMGVTVAVSVWPTVNPNSVNYGEMKRRNLLIRAERGQAAHFEFIDAYQEGEVSATYYDATNPEAQEYIWQKVDENYYTKYGIKCFWLDQCEPEIKPYHPENFRFYLGNGEEVANLYPLLHQKAFYDGLTRAGEPEIATLCRAAWLGSQRYGAIVWSGDIASDFKTLQVQIRAGLNMAMSGIPWWNTDIGGFGGGDPTDPAFQEVAVRWFQYGTFCPIMRLHGVRRPACWKDVPSLTGAPNEIWSFGEEACGIMARYIRIRERMKPYVMEQMKIAHETGVPPMRPLLVDFPDDPQAVAVDDAFLFGPDLLVCPVAESNQSQRAVYLPQGCSWVDAWSGEAHAGGQTITAEAPIERIPLFLRNGSRTVFGGEGKLMDLL